jgi:hypothetical protein
LVAGVLGSALVACGEEAAPAGPTRSQQALEDCRSQWREVGDSVVGMDQDPHPSALSDRWTTVIATVDYYQHTKTAEDCRSTVDAQLHAISALRRFGEQLRPYDMTYQLDQVRAAIDLYLNDPLPTGVRGENGRPVKPPSKAAVRAAMATLAENAEQANAELEPGWTQTSSVDLDDVDALTKTMKDLDFLAQDSPHWRACEEALQVLVAAVRAQESGGTPTAEPSP